MVYNSRPPGTYTPKVAVVDDDAPPKRTPMEYLFTLIVGSMYIYALNRVIISATFIWVTQTRLFVMGMVSLVIFAVIFYNRYTRIITGVAVLIVGLFVLLTLEMWGYQFNHLGNVLRMVQGYIPYRSDLGITVLWGISLLLGLAVAIFMLYRFSFYILALTGIIIFLFTWGPGFTRDMFSFLLFIFCFCLLLIRKTNNGLGAVYVAAPICAALVWFIHGNVPTEADLFQRRTINELFEGPLSAIGDFIYTLTNPMYFSFQSTGFSGHGGRLGGPVTPNNRNVMTVQAPGRTYLAGATHNIYTGYTWTSNLQDGDLYTQGMNPSRFEMVETAAALIRGATLLDERATIPQSMLWNMFPIYDHMLLSLRHFATLGLEGYPQYQYLHTYLPIDQVTVAIGTNRTGTVFRPPNVRQMWFHAAGPNYMPRLMFDPSGDIRAPVFMARNTQYTMNFLNVNPRLTFVSDLLNESFAGIYATREPMLPETVLPPFVGTAIIEGYTVTFEGDRTISVYRENEEGGIVRWDFIAAPGGSIIVDTINAYDSGGNLTYPDMPSLSDAAMMMIQSLEPFETTDTANIVIDLENLVATATDINRIFDQFAHQSPNRELSYLSTHGEIMAMLDVFSRDVLSLYAESVRRHFLQVPEITPQRVHDLVAEIIYGLETDFEKVMAIRDYLVQFTYTLSPPPVPYGVCFVDHFLFDAREGYCTYYASAMAIMARIAGVPSRYVEGFLLPPAEADPAPSVFVVTNMMAHAWVEVYLEGFGWLIVEATAPYAFFMDPAMPPPMDAITPDWPTHGWWDYWEDDMMYYYMRGDRTPGQGYIPTQPGGPAGDVPARGMLTASQVRMYVLIGLIGLGIIALLILLARYIQVNVRAKRIARLAINQQIAAYFNGIIDITSHCTNPIDPTETPYAYGQKMGRRFAFKSDSVLLKDLVDLYYKARFGNNELTEQERELMEDSYIDMVNHLRRENKKPNFIYLRYIRQVGVV